MTSSPSAEGAPRSAGRNPRVAVVGNPNAGKTTLFNALTGSHQKVGNYPGVTVERVSGELRLGKQVVECIDVPGLYSLDAVSEDERVAAEVIRREGVDLLVCVVDATNLERNLYLFTQIAELRLPTLVALTMVDRVDAAGRTLDVERLESELGVPVVPVVGHREQGLEALQLAIAKALDQPTLVEPKAPADVAGRYEWASEVQRRSVRSTGAPARRSLTDRIDMLLTHRVLGLAIFVGVMYLVFQSIYSFATPLMDLIESGFGWLQGVVGPRLEGVPVLQSLVVDGIIAGVGSVVVFLPQILILFFFIAVLEGTGYLARAAFLMDRLLGWAGLNGRAFIPLLSSFACAIPGIMAARVMPDPKSRLATILVAPLMSCSARLPVYVLLIGAFIQPRYGAFWAGFALFAMHFLGLLVAIPIVWVLNRKVLRGSRLPFLLELPPYQWPKWKDVGLAMWFRGKVFLHTAGTIIFVMSVLIWALSYFPRMSPAQLRAEEARYVAVQPQATPEQIEHHLGEAQLGGSYLGRFGKAIAPVFAPAGFDWRITTAILAAFPARETVVPSLGVLFSLGGDVDEGSTDLRDSLHKATWPDGRPLFTLWTSIGLMVFFALCAQCMATLATVRRETNSWKWAAFMFAYMTLLAYAAAVAIHQVGRALGA